MVRGRIIYLLNLFNSILTLPTYRTIKYVVGERIIVARQTIRIQKLI